MPFFICQKCTFRQEFRQKVRILPLEYDYKKTYCNSFIEFPCYIVLSLLPKVWSHRDEHHEAHLCHLRLKYCYLFIDSCKWYEYSIFSEVVANVCADLWQNNKNWLFYSSKWAISSKINIFATTVVFRHFVSFRQKWNPSEPNSSCPLHQSSRFLIISTNYLELFSCLHPFIPNPNSIPKSPQNPLFLLAFNSTSWPTQHPVQLHLVMFVLNWRFYFKW